jgi:hypothetical protein
MSTITKQFAITATPSVMRRFERFLCFFHYNGGHSGIFGMPFDGDGSDRLKVYPAPERANGDHHLIANAGPELEIALDDCYKSFSLNRDRRFYTAKDGVLEWQKNTDSGPETGVCNR